MKDNSSNKGKKKTAKQTKKLITLDASLHVGYPNHELSLELPFLGLNQFISLQNDDM